MNKDFGCPYCPKPYHRQTDLAWHVYRKHSQKKVGIYCDSCQKIRVKLRKYCTKCWLEREKRYDLLRVER